MDIRQELTSRIIEPFAKYVFCDDGWLSLLTDLHDELIKIDPNYTIYQVKEKFGGLCFYYSPSNPTHDEAMRNVVREYEQKSYLICEKTGQPGNLKVKNNWLKTLSDSFIDEGWTKLISNEPGIKRIRNWAPTENESDKR